MGDQPLLQLIEVRQVQLVARGNFADIAQQVADFGSAPIRDVLVHRGVIGGGGVDHPFDFLLQVLGRGRLAAALKQLGQFAAEGGDFAMMVLQAAVAAIVQHRQRIDRTVERQFSPQPGEDVGAPFVGNAGGVRSSSQIGATGWPASPSQV